MPRSIDPNIQNTNLSFHLFFKPARQAMEGMPMLTSGCNRPLQMSFEDHLKALVYFHLQQHTSAQHLLQVLEEDDYAREHIAPKDGIKKSSFSEVTNTRGLGSLRMCSRIFRFRHLPFCLRDIRRWVILLQLTVRLLMQSFR